MEIYSRNDGSITLEASIMVPLFIILMLLVNGIFILFMGQQIMSHALIQSTKSLAFDPYASQRVAADSEDKLADMFVDIFSFTHENYISTEQWYDGSQSDLEEAVEKRFLAYLTKQETDADKLLKIIGVKGGVSGLDFSECSVSDGMLTVKLKYTQEFIFNAAGLASFEQILCLKTKLFQY